MGIFGKKKKDEFSHLHNDNLLLDDDDFVFSATKKKSDQAVGNGTAVAPHALTKNEVLNTSTEEIPMNSRPQPDSVYKMMKEREQKNTASAISDDYVPSWATEVKTEPQSQEKDKSVSSDSDVLKTAESVMASLTKPQTTEPEEPVEKKETVETPKTEITVTAEHSAVGDAFLERCRIALEKAADNDSKSDDKKDEEPDTVKSVETVKDGNDSTDKDAAQSVDDIVKMLRGNSHSDGNNKPVTVTPVSAFETDSDKKADEDTVKEDTTEKDETVTAAETVGREIKVEVEVIPTDSDSDIMHTTANGPEADSDVRIYGRVKNGAVVQQNADGDDIAATQFVKAINTATRLGDTIVADGNTIMMSDLGDIGDVISQRADSDFDSTEDLDDDDYYEDTPYYESEDTELRGIKDYTGLDDAAVLKVKHGNELSKNKTVAIFTSVLAGIAFVVSALQITVASTTSVSLTLLILLATATVMNCDLFLDFKNLFKMRPRFDSLVAIATVITLAQGVVAYLSSGHTMSLCAVATILIAVNRIAKFMKSKRIMHGLELIANSEPKRAVVSVSGSNAKVISSGAVDGEALVLCDRKVVNVQNYIKNCSYDSPFERKLKVLMITGAAVAVAAGVLVGYFTSFAVGLSVAASVLLCIWPSTAALVCELPMFLADRKAARYDSAIAGYKGAYELNQANLVAVNSHDLFPDGSVKLYNMKTLGENEIGKTLLDAAAVAIAADSPLANIFRDIIGSGFQNDIPKVGGVQYEDKMGISGWIGERTILIGNRNLMQGHSVPVPPATVDQKILKAGYFPVYIAVSGVPCLLFLVKYEPDVTVVHELQNLCSTGMTVVVDPNDPNTTSDMLCDYFGLPNDALKVMNHNGRVSYERCTADVENASAPALFRKNICGFFSSVASAINLPNVYSILTAVMIIAAVLGSSLTIYLAIASKLSLLASLPISCLQLIFVAISTLIAKLKI